MSRCICNFPDECQGDGILLCRGCGGDFCVCAACYGNGEMDCPGCPACSGEIDDEEVPDA